MVKLATAVILSSIAFAQTAQQAEIAVAAKSPITLARYVDSHQNDIDWAALWVALGTHPLQGPYPLCGDTSVYLVYSCSTEIITVLNPDQAILIIQSSGTRACDVYLRYLQEANEVWRFDGSNLATLYDNYPRGHEVRRSGTKPFLTISSDLSQVGGGFRQRVEDWFDLTQPDFEPVFSSTTDASLYFGYPIRREVKAQASPSVSLGVETIQVNLSITLDGVDGSLGACMYRGVYERTTASKKFALRSAYAGLIGSTRVAPQDFAALSGIELATEPALKCALPRLKQIAMGSSGDARQWLRDVLARTKDTPEKRTLLELLAKP